MNYVISIIAPERLEILTDLCEGLGLPLTVTLHGLRDGRAEHARPARH